jgi:hypothetical protein
MAYRIITNYKQALTPLTKYWLWAVIICYLSSIAVRLIIGDDREMSGVSLIPLYETSKTITLVTFLNLSLFIAYLIKPSVGNEFKDLPPKREKLDGQS